jgi:hypothetical protein
MLGGKCAAALPVSAREARIDSESAILLGDSAIEVPALIIDCTAAAIARGVLRIGGYRRIAIVEGPVECTLATISFRARGVQAGEDALGGGAQLLKPSTSSEQTSENHRFNLREDFGSRHTAGSLIPVVVDASEKGHRFFVNSVSITAIMFGGFPHGEPCGLGRCRGRQLPRAHFPALHLRSSRYPSFGIESPGCEKVTARSCPMGALAWADRMCHDPSEQVILEAKRMSQ